MNHQEQERLEQELLELHYGLLEESEAQTLRSRIENEASVAKLWAKTLEMAGQFADAANLAGVTKVNGIDRQPLELPNPEERGPVSRLNGVAQNNFGNQSVNSETAEPEVVNRFEQADVFPPIKSVQKHLDKHDSYEAAEAKFKTERKWNRRWMFVAATLATCFFAIITGQFLNNFPEAPSAAIRIEAESLQSNDSSPNSFEFFTSTVSSQAANAASLAQGVSASLSVAVKVNNVIVHSDKIETGDSGNCTYIVPPELRIPKGAKLYIRPDNSPDNKRIEVVMPLAPTRCLTYLNVDKPVYRPGEVVHFRSLTLERFTLHSEIDLPIRFVLLDPSGAAVKGAKLEGVTERGVGNGEFQIPQTAPGGQYTLVVSSLDGFFPEERRTFQVRNYRAPRIKKDIEFRRRSYGPGELVEAEFEAIRAEGGAVDSKKVMVTAKVDGDIVYNDSAKTDASGRCLISFKLPEHISKGSGQLACVIDDGGTLEVQTKTIPIQLGKVEVDFYPEGGYLVDGIPNRVYFAARNPLGKPIHISGEIIDRSGKQVAKLETTRDGMGRFELTPRSGQRYSLKVTDPIDVINSPQLPAVVKDLPVLSTGKGVFATDENIAFEIKASKSQKVVVQLACRGSLIVNVAKDLEPGTTSMEIEVPETVEGVLRLTVLNAETAPATPLVERLVYRELKRKLTVKVEEDQTIERTPGEPVRLTLRVFDENGEPAPAVLGVAVVDDSALSLQEHEQPQMQTHFMLTSEIEQPEDLEHANFYLSGSKESKESLDLLLGTQGWRRFVTSQNMANASSSSFIEQINRLIELDGKSAHPVAAANVRAINQQWRYYSVAKSRAWKKFWTDFRWLVLPLIILMLAIYLFRPRFRFVATGLCLMVACYTTAMVGCGAPSAAPNSGAAMDMAESKSPAVANEARPQFEPNDADFARPEEEAGMAPPPLVVPAIADQKRARPNSLPKPNLGSGREKGQLKVINHDPQEWDGDSHKPGRFAADRTTTEVGTGRITEDQLAVLLAARGLKPGDLGVQLLDELRFPIREYAHQHVSTQSDLREDFTETICWQPLLITDSTGRANVRFELSDSVTTFKVLADAHSSVGKLGSGGGEVISRLPLQIEPKMPIAVTDGDRIDLPVAVINATKNPLAVDLVIRPDSSFELVGPESLDWKLEKEERTRGNFGLKVISANNEGKASIELKATSGKGTSGTGLADSIRRSVIVTPSGYPVRESLSGVVEGQKSLKLPIPSDAVSGSLAVTVKAYPSPLADLLGGVESILREPHGCFEQTSATNYPNTMALLYLQENRLTNPATTRRAKSLLDRGYQKLISFECDRLGYEWFGSDPGHEALSAFGLLQFTDMSKVMTVNTEMMIRTRTWLLKRRDGNGSFKRNKRHLHQWSVKQQIVDAYVLWALTEADVASGNPQRSASELANELDRLNKVARESSDPYLVSLAAASLKNAQRETDAEFLMSKLADFQKANGEWVGQTTVTQSGGISRSVETTSVAMLALSKDPKYSAAVSHGAKFLTSNRNGAGGFGSTQATVLALKALVAYAKVASKPSSGGRLLVKHNGAVIGQATLPAEVTNGTMIEINDLGSNFDFGAEANIELVAEGSDRLPYSIEILYHTNKPPTDDRCPLELQTKLELTSGKDGQVESGETMKVKAVLTNKTDEGKPMTVATIGLPGGVEPVIEQLNEMKEAGLFDFYEVRPREVTLYWRTIGPSETKEISFDVTAEISGKYTGPSSRAYLYYTAEQKIWAEPLAIEIGK